MTWSSAPGNTLQSTPRWLHKASPSIKIKHVFSRIAPIPITACCQVPTVSCTPWILLLWPRVEQRKWILAKKQKQKHKQNHKKKQIDRKNHQKKKKTINKKKLHFPQFLIVCFLFFPWFWFSSLFFFVCSGFVIILYFILFFVKPYILCVVGLIILLLGWLLSGFRRRNRGTKVKKSRHATCSFTST